MFGQFGHFYKFAKDPRDHSYALERYTKETKRLLAVLDRQLSQSPYVATNEVTIADFATAPWVACLDEFYQASKLLELEKFTSVHKWLDLMKKRPAYQKGSKVCA